MKILVDMNLSPLWVPFLNGRGFQASHWSGIGAASAPDAIGETVVRAIETARSNLQAGALVSIDLGGHRVRLLPL